MRAINAETPLNRTPRSPRPPSQPYRVLLTVRQFADKHPAFPQGSLRNLLFHAQDRTTSRGIIKANGLGVALVRINRRVLIDEKKFFQWIEHQTSKVVA